MQSLKQVKTNFGKKRPCEQGCKLDYYLSFLLLFEFWIPLFFQFKLIMAVYAALMKKKCVKSTTFDAFLRSLNFMF